MEKRLQISLSFFMVFLLAGLVLADNNLTNNQSSGNSSSLTLTSGSSGAEAKIDTTTENEVKVMTDNHGAKIRILQLQRAINKMILYAGAIIEVIKKKGNNTSELENIVEEMKLVLEDAKALDPNSDTAVQDFVDVKEDAIKLRKEFRDAAKGLLTASDKKALREKFKEIDRTKVKSLTEQIRKERCILNANRIKKLGELAGVDVSEYVKKVESCELRPVQALKQLKIKYTSLSPAKKKEIRQKIRSNIKKKDLVRARKLVEAKKRRYRNIEVRAQKRADLLRKKGFPILASRLQKRAELFRARALKANKVANKLKNINKLK